MTEALLRKIYTRLYNAGFESIKLAPGRPGPGGGPDTLLVDGARVEVKTAAARDSRGRWLINLHRHGELDETDVDAYLILLSGVPDRGPMSLYIVLPAPQRVKLLAFSVSSLMRLYAGNIEDWETLKAIAKRAKKPTPAAILQGKTVESDLEKIAAPLDREVISSADLIVTDEPEILEASISSNDKEFFSVPESEKTRSEVEVAGTIISADKETQQGVFKRLDGVKVRYKFVGKDSQSFYSSFSHKGVVRVFATAIFDENLELRRLEIARVVRLQPESNLSNSENQPT